MSRNLLRALYPQAFEEADRDDRDLGVAVAAVWRRVARAARSGGGDPEDIRVIRTILKVSARQRPMLEAYKPLADEAFRARKRLAGKASRVRRAEWERVRALRDELAPLYKGKSRAALRLAIAKRVIKKGVDCQTVEECDKARARYAARVRYIEGVPRPKR